jgi:hypothetical protein
LWHHAEQHAEVTTQELRRGIAPQPGWHRWETPSGWVYEQEPKRYPV